MELYFSSRCQHSNNLIQLIQSKETLAKNVKAISIDHHPYPPNVTRVPTIIKDNQVFIGRDAFQLVEDYKHETTMLSPAESSNFTSIDNTIRTTLPEIKKVDERKMSFDEYQAMRNTEIQIPRKQV